MTEDLGPVIARLRATLEERAARADADEARAKKPPRAGTLARFDTARLGARLRPRLEKDGRGWRELGEEIGVTVTDLSRICAGQHVSAEKVFAACDWLKIDPRKFYRAASSASRRASAAAPPAAGEPAPVPDPGTGRATTPGLRSKPRPSAACFTGKALKQPARKTKGKQGGKG